MANAKNNSILYGRILNDPTFIKTKDGKEFATRFVLAVDRGYKNKEGVYESDFIPVKFTGVERMNFAHNFKKMDNVIVSGSIKSERFLDGDQYNYSIYVEADSVAWTYGRSEKKEEKENGFEIDLKSLPFQ